METINTNEPLTTYEQNLLQAQQRAESGIPEYFIRGDELIVKIPMDNSFFLFNGTEWKATIIPIDEEKELEIISSQEVAEKNPIAYKMAQENLLSEELLQHKRFLKRLNYLLYPDALEQEFLTAILRFSAQEREEINKALIFAKEKHKGVYRKENTPYHTHCIDTALYAVNAGEDAEMIITLLLHDIVEDVEEVNVSDISENFTPQIGQNVQGLSKNQFDSIEAYYKNISNNPKLRKAKAYDRLSNTLGLYFVTDKNWKENYIQATRENIIPLVQGANQDLANKIEAALVFVETNPITTEEHQQRVSDLMEARNISSEIK